MQDLLVRSERPCSQYLKMMIVELLGRGKMHKTDSVAATLSIKYLMSMRAAYAFDSVPGESGISIVLTQIHGMRILVGEQIPALLCRRLRFGH